MLAAFGCGGRATSRHRRFADLRYAGQGHEIRVDRPTATLGPTSLPRSWRAFDEVYRALFGRTGPHVPLEAVSWRVVSTGPRPAFKLARTPEAAAGERR